MDPLQRTILLSRKAFKHKGDRERQGRRFAHARNPEGQGLVHMHVDALIHAQFRCPCCGFKTLETPGSLGLCPVCWWEDDGQEDADASEVRLTVNGTISLSEAREHYARCGAAHPRFIPHVRKPKVTEE